MKSLSDEISTLIINDLMNKTKSKHYNIYKKQKKDSMIFNIFNLFIIITLIINCLLVFFVASFSNSLMTLPTILLCVLPFFFKIGSYVQYLNLNPFFGVKSQIKSLKVVIINIMENQNENKNLKEEATNILKIINDNKQIKKIICNTRRLRLINFYEYFKSEQKKPYNVIENKSINVKKNLEIIKKELELNK